MKEDKSKLPPWYLVAWLEMETGVHEIVGKEHNPRIIEYRKTTTSGASDDETPWCSDFVNWCMVASDIEGTKKPNARSWLKWGKEISKPKEGCVVVFSRGTEPWQGHVGFYVGKKGDQILCLGGNQSNEVNISSYPKSRVLSYRWSEF